VTIAQYYYKSRKQYYAFAYASLVSLRPMAFLRTFVLKKVIFAHLAYLVLLERLYGPLDSKLEQRFTNSITELDSRQFSATVRCYRVKRGFLHQFILPSNLF
jgi:hypothetical protein